MVSIVSPSARLVEVEHATLGPIIAGCLSKSNMSILLVGNIIKKQLKLQLTQEEVGGPRKMTPRRGEDS